MTPAAILAETLRGNSVVIRKLREIIIRVAASSISVLIQGPTGAGKELVAHAVHAYGRPRGRFVPVNVCAISQSMFEDALFGHTRGAFTGATSDAAGYMAEADGGTLFLDEISGLGLPHQATLLRAIETRQFRPVGASRDRTSHFRLVAASNEDLSSLVGCGDFRPDLLHRLDGITISVPSLAERRDDIPELARHFLGSYSPDHAIRLSSAAERFLQERDWPGNVRELRNTLERAAILAEARELTRVDVERAVRGDAAAKTAPGCTARSHLISVLEQCNWEPQRAAGALRVHWTTVYRRMRKLGIAKPGGTGHAEVISAN